LCIPSWIALLRIVPTSFRKRYRVKHGLCLNCGYDLRASPDRCPECGRAVKAST
jgi:predicted amidophosphoribosyltransferase